MGHSALQSLFFRHHVLTATRAATILMLIGCAASAQTFTGRIIGRVVDSQQAGITGASVTLRSVEREFERHTATNSQGEYTFELVPPGKFRVTAESSGFAPAAVDLEAAVAASVRADLTLQIRRAGERIEVFGESGVGIQTDNANMGGVISGRQISELPSLGRSLYDFIALIPGATFSNDAIGVGYAVNGGRTQSANYLVDGAEDNDIMMSAPAMDVPLDSIQEFNIQTNHLSAQYGRNSGFTANIVTKSGTKQFHGSLYDYVRNSAFAANTFANNANGLPRPVFNRHQFGGTAGGPVANENLFFFISTEAIRVRSSGPNTFYVPTPQLLAMSAPGTRAIFDRFPVPVNISASNVHWRLVCPFGASCNSQTAAGFVSVPAFAFTSRIGPQDFGAGAPQNTILGTGRLDWIAGGSTQAFVRYAIENKDEFALAFQPYSSKLDQPLYGHNQNVSVNVIRTWSPKMVTESRVAYARVTGDPDRFGGDGYAVPRPLFPAFSILNEAVSLPGGTPGYFGPTNIYHLFQTGTYSRGNHIFHFGGQFVHLRQNLTFGFGEVADARFANTQDFVDGALQSFAIALDPKGKFPGEYVDPPFGPPNFRRHYHYNEPALFAEDSWKLTPRLTLSPGLRWEYFGVFHSAGTEHKIDSNFYPGVGASLPERIANGQMLRTVDAPGDLRGRFYVPSFHDFAPRLGLAYDLFGNGKTVFRTGGGLFYDRSVGWELFRAYQNPPSYSLSKLIDVTLTAEMVKNQYAAFPNIPVQLGESAIFAPDTHLQSAYASAWNASLEHEVRGAFVLGASYLGSSGSRLYSLNRVDRTGSGGLLDPSCTSSRIAADGLTAIGPDYSSCPRLYPNATTIVLRGNGGHSSYHALQLQFDGRRISNLGLQFGTNYTWSHSIDNRSVSGVSLSVADTGTGYLDAFNPALDRASSDFDVRHRIAGYFIWELPVAKNSQRWFASSFLRGWEASGFLSYQTGQPFGLADSATPDALDDMTRPRLTGPLLHAVKPVPDLVSPNNYLYLPVNQVYDPLNGRCIATAAPFACEISVNGPFEGVLPRNAFRQPGLFFLNTAFLKNFVLPQERLRLQLRFEFYNILNHANFYVNGSSTDVSTDSFRDHNGSSGPGVTASFRDNRQIVLAAKFFF